LAKDTHGNVTRLVPPLVISKDELDWALERIEDVLMMD
jgi:ornithine--oxo-acid transaminase